MQVIAYPYQYLIFNIEHSRYSKFKILHSIAFKLKFLTNEAGIIGRISTAIGNDPMVDFVREKRNREGLHQ